jgi:hypothetical protein
MGGKATHVRWEVGSVVAAAALLIALAGTTRGASLSEDDLLHWLESSEEAFTSLRCLGRVAILGGGEFHDSYLAVPASAPFDHAFHKGDLEWAFVGDPSAGKVYVGESLRIGHLEEHPSSPTGGYRRSDRYSMLEREFAFDGEFGTSLNARSALLPIGTVSAGTSMLRVGAVTAAPPVPEPGFGDLQGLTLWAAGDALSRCLQKGRARYVGSEATQDGRLLCRVDVASQRHEGLEIRLWVDASRGFAVVRRQHVYLDAPPGMEVYEETLSVDLKEWAPGVWFPREVIFGGSQPAEVGRLLVDSVQVNQELDGTLFTVQFPPGTQVTDEVRGVRYTVPHAASPSGPVPGQAAGLHGT